MWGGAGLLLLIRTVGLVETSLHGMALLGATCVGGALFFHTVFQRVARRHIRRMEEMHHEQPCAFSFLDWRGYGIMALMIGGGILLRISGAFPGPWIGALYGIMGTALALASVQFFKAGLQERSSRQPYTPA